MILSLISTILSRIANTPNLHKPKGTKLSTPKPLSIPERILLGPGPSDVAPSVLLALASPTIGHLDPVFLDVMDQIRRMLRHVMGTRNRLTMPMSGTGSAGMETCLVNLVQPGDRVLVGVNGVFGTRIAEVAGRCGAQVTTVEAPWGMPIALDAFRTAAGNQSYKLVCVVHAETSTGVLQDLTGLSALAKSLGALLLVDAVTSLGGLAVEADRWGIDAIYSGTQKCLSCPPGLSPVSFSPAAVKVLERRRTPVASWYLDLSLIRQYWSNQRLYHHTAPINMIFALHEALRLVLEEGLPNRIERHRVHAMALWAGLEAMGLSLPVPEHSRLYPLTVVRVPDGVKEAVVRGHLLAEYGLEIGAGLGPMKGKVWRIGLMGHGCCRKNVTLCLSSLANALRAQGHQPLADPLPAAENVYIQSGSTLGQ